MSRQKNSEWPLESNPAPPSSKYTALKRPMAAFLFRRLLQGPRVQSAFLSRLGRGKATAKTSADEITQGQHISLELTANQRLEIQRAFEILAPLNIPLDVAANRYAQAIR